MGVTRGTRDLFFPDIIDDELDQLELAPAEEYKDDTVQSKKKTPKKCRSHGRTDNQRDTATLLYQNRKRTGSKQARRYENLRQLFNLAEKDDINDLDFNIYEPSMSAFAELFMEREKMKAWNDFINRSEEEQEKILDSECFVQCDDAVEEKTQEDLEHWEEIPDQRSVHPSFSAEECFKRIDRNIKAALRKKHLPVDLLMKLEKEIVSFFKEWPTSVYISLLSNGHERMMMHAICQYLNLYSKSYDYDGKRQTHVENRQHSFSPPSVLLSQFLSSRAKASH
ncbi:hypothetical protein ScPMuIL_006385 [Solemya velum]